MREKNKCLLKNVRLITKITSIVDAHKKIYSSNSKMLFKNKEALRDALTI